MTITDDAPPAAAPAPKNSMGTIVATSSDPLQTLKMYYQRFFPFKRFHAWLSYHAANPQYFARREFSFAVGEQQDIVVRFASYTSKKEFKEAILSMTPTIPKRIDIGAVYTLPPKSKAFARPGTFKPVEKEMVFDIDMTDYDELRTCCKGGDICHKCWVFMTISVRILHTALKDDFGFKHILWVYSGRRGVHCWIGDKRARAMSEEGRRSIVSYLELIKGGDEQAKKVRLPGLLHPSILRAQHILEPYFPSVIDAQDVLTNPAQSENLLKIILDEDLRKLAERKLKAASSGQEFCSSLKKLCATQSASLRNTYLEIMFQFLYPRLDAKVSMQLNHLLKAPFCVHPKTGKVCVPMHPESADDFDPMTVPTVTSLEEALNIFDAENPGMRDPTGKDKKMAAWMKTPLRPYIEHFDVFLQGLKQEAKISNAERKIDSSASW